MTKLKIGALPDERPVKVSFELPASVHRDLVAYAAALVRETGQPVSDPSKLIAPMLARFMATDRAFCKTASYDSITRCQRRIAFGQEFEDALQGGIVIIGSPMRRKINACRPGPVAQFTIDHAGKACANI
jgi:hypothetical protein